MTVAELASIAKLSPEATRRRLAGLKPGRGPGRAQAFEAAEALPVLFGIGERRDPSTERARLDAARADLAELDLARKRGDLIEAHRVAEVWTAIITTAKGRMMALPARLAADMVATTDIREADNRIRAAIYEVLEELASTRPRYGPGDATNALPEPSRMVEAAK